MEIRVLTLRYSPSLGAIDDAPLVLLARDHDVLGVREHFFVVHDIPHLVCVVSCQPRTATTSTAASPIEPTAMARTPAPPPAPAPAPTRSTDDPTAELEPEQQRLYDTIRRWRYATAQRDGVPPYVVLTNRNLTALLRERPATLAALGRIRGIGRATIERHGQALLALLRGEPPAGPTLVAMADPPDDHGPAPASADAPLTDPPTPTPEPEPMADA